MKNLRRKIVRKKIRRVRKNNNSKMKDIIIPNKKLLEEKIRKI